MKSLKTILSVIGIIVKYGAVVTAILKGIQVVSDELEKLDLGKDDVKTSSRPLQIQDEPLTTETHE
ncbi:hypothetical protein OIU80_19110 [Flavobacterium sp. LS1R47]|uniref:Uncharacterized protein n=1 Tax=Flavobacterium frigoritolerans TaxID=2987686 RepID=A0A9X3CA36_9FLAO|nr:hypothetical protein [Flavobacterium frigoritolerans]MCV9934394.1 hypothetical protein [Flavobacterium frigoritolerans]